MPRLRWSQAMSVGVPSLDGDHRCLVRIINLLDEATAADLPRMIDIVLDTLIVYGRFHFGREERVMVACGFPGIDIHRAEHAGFTESVARLKARFAHVPAGSASTAIAAALRRQLSDWLLHHILIQDMAFKPYVADREAGDDEPALDWAPPPVEVVRPALAPGQAPC